MHIYLQDLGRAQQMALLRRRVTALNGQAYGQRSEAGLTVGDIAAAPPLGWLGRLWARGTGSAPEVVSAGLNTMRGQNLGMMWGMLGGSIGFWMPGALLVSSGALEPGAFMLALGAVMSGVGLWVPGYWLRRVCRPPLSTEEAEALRVAATDPLERAYLQLVEDAVRQGVALEAADQLRTAVRAVGEALGQLPVVAGPRANVDTLRADAAQAQAEMQGEPDAVVAASHERRAEALRRSALAAQRSQTLMRRNAALRDEMMAQIESLRLGLAGFETASGDVSGLASLAEAVRSVAAEAAAAADARDELDVTLSSIAAVPVTTWGEGNQELHARN